MERVTAKMAHTFQNFKSALQQVTLERDELQNRIDQQEEEETDHQQWEHLLGYNMI